MGWLFNALTAPTQPALSQPYYTQGPSPSYQQRTAGLGGFGSAQQPQSQPQAPPQFYTVPNAAAPQLFDGLSAFLPAQLPFGMGLGTFLILAFFLAIFVAFRMFTAFQDRLFQLEQKQSHNPTLRQTQDLVKNMILEGRTYERRKHVETETETEPEPETEGRRRPALSVEEGNGDDDYND